MVALGPRTIRSGSPFVPSGENFQATQPFSPVTQRANAVSIDFSLRLMVSTDPYIVAGVVLGRLAGRFCPRFGRQVGDKDQQNSCDREQNTVFCLIFHYLASFAHALPSFSILFPALAL